MDRPLSRWRPILEAYNRLEAGEGDSWTPLRNPFELSYRLCVFYALAQAVEKTAESIESLSVLDVGCGNGRTTRMYIDLGFRPEQLVGIDLRPGTIALARRLHPTIRFEVQEGDAIPFPDRAFDWVSLIGVASSIAHPASRQYLVDQIHDKLRSGGHFFYFDLCRAPAFAGGGWIRPRQYTAAFERRWERSFRSFHFVPAGEKWRHFLGELRVFDRHWAGRLRARVGQFVRPSHEALLLRKRAV